MSSEPLNSFLSYAGKRAALIVAHPGHELRVHGWLERARPSVCVITDGSGRTQLSRRDSTTTVLKAAGCSAGPVYGVMTDQELYSAVLDLNHAPFIRLVDEIAAMLVNERIEYVAGDAAERYNPAHDICRMIIDAAVALADRNEQRNIKNFDFTLVNPPDEGIAAHGAGAIRIELTEAELTRKLSAARNYPELQAEVAAALAGDGSVGFQQHPDLARQTGQVSSGGGPYEFAVEYLRPVQGDLASALSSEMKTPFYELYGERKVSDGEYDRVLRYQDHMRPLAEAIQFHVEHS